MDYFSERILCSDGNCIGTIDRTGVCNICGKPLIVGRRGQERKEKGGEEFVTSKKPAKKKLLHAILASFFIVSILVGLYVILSKKDSKPTVFTKPWITISYADLIDPRTIIRTGQSLKSALLDPSLRGAVQSFVDPYSYLLQYSIEMLSGVDRIPHGNIVDHYPIGSTQPAWVAILRGGRIHITTDNRDHARVFLLGEDPQKEYLGQYSVIRHCLNALVPTDGSNLNIEVFTYKNNYNTSELMLNPNPYNVSASSFPSNKIPPDLSGLKDFFDLGPEIQGAQLDHTKGLVLYGKSGPKQTLAGANISLSDFAVAYRATFHAGDNEAFISLDPNNDPTKATVNFGGFLQDTRIGSVVLEADKRFKTITCGLDPNSFKDLRRYSREHVPSYMSVAERDLLDQRFLTHGKWIGTRFWFYPDSVGIESDLDYQFALITKPQFTADAERSKEDFGSPEEFEKKKNTTLSPSIRKNINHVNQNYTKYANAFKEIEELSTVARFMGLCSWLYKARPQRLDLDTLLAVELPPLVTERERTQLIAASFISFLKSEDMNEDYVIKNAGVIYLSPILEKAVGEYFKNPTNVAKYLCLKHGVDENNHSAYASDSLRLFNEYRSNKVRDIIDSKEALKALATYSAQSVSIAEPAIIKSIKSDKETLDKLESEIKKISHKINNANRTEYNQLVDEHNELVNRHEIIRRRLNQNIEKLKKLDPQSPSVIEIGGGINLEPRNFKIRATQSSPKIREFKEIIDKVSTEWRSIAGAGRWISSKAGAGVTEITNKLPKRKWALEKETTSGNSKYRFTSDDPDHKYWSAVDSQNGSWRDCFKIDTETYRERTYDPESKKLQVAEFRSRVLRHKIVGQMESTGRIVFQRLERKVILNPQEPPVWFPKN